MNAVIYPKKKFSLSKLLLMLFRFLRIFHPFMVHMPFLILTFLNAFKPSSLNSSKWSSISDFKITAFVQSPTVAYLDISLQISLFLGCVPWRSKKWCLLPSVDSHVSLMQFDIRKLTSILPSLFRVGFITGDLTNVSSTKYLPKK